MQKQELLRKINNILQTCGDFSTGEIQADCSPCVESRGNLVHLVERFSTEAKVVVYNDEIDVDEYSIAYQELTTETLQQILDLCLEWQEINQKETKTIEKKVKESYDNNR